jgi:hypothetical protein
MMVETTSKEGSAQPDYVSLRTGTGDSEEGLGDLDLAASH